MEAKNHISLLDGLRHLKDACMHVGFGDRIGPTSSQVPRLWVSPQGAVSPLHFDASSSFLIQLQGRKRMLFWPPSDLPGLYPYHNLHLLRRRARVDPVNPDYKRFPRFRSAR